MLDLAGTKVLLASNNAAKLAELNFWFAKVNLTAVSISEFSKLAILPVPEEVGETFAANAYTKAKYYAQYWSGPVLADDSGLEVVALNNQPGVKSNRWLAGSDQDRNKAILARLQGNSDRQAKFIAVICWLESATASPVFFRGEVAGKIALNSAGQAGFGYDPIFIPEGFDKTFAELGGEVKNKLSHRALALGQLLKFLGLKNT